MGTKNLPAPEGPRDPATPVAERETGAADDSPPARVGSTADRKAARAALEVERTARLRAGLAQAFERAKKRVARRVQAIAADLSRIDEADALCQKAQWFVATAHKTPRGARAMTVTDWSTGEAQEITLPLDPAKSAREQVDALFKKARRIKRGVAIAKERHAEAEKRGAALTRLSAEVAAAEGEDALVVLAKKARAAAPGDFAFDPEAAARPAGAPRAAQPRRKAFRTFRSAGDVRIYVGRGGADNDELTLHVAKPRDLWLHARGRAGAHVVVPLAKGHACPPDVLVDAAHLAAHFSDGRGEAVVEVEYTPKRFLRKPRGSPAGFVVVTREKVLALRVDDARVARLVAHEEALGEGA